MTTRKINNDNDWTFGSGRGNYVSGVDEVAQNIKTRLQSFLGDCFFSLSEGVDWFNLIGSKRILEIRLAVSSTILNTDNVLSMIELDVELSDSRNLTITYTVNTVYGEISDTVEQGI